MANKRKRKRLREAAERARKKDETTMARRWNALTAQYDEDKLYTYDVAAQIKDGAPMYTGIYEAPNDEELLELVVRHMGVNSESEFANLFIHKEVEGGSVIVIRECGSWPNGVTIIRTKGITRRGYINKEDKIPVRPAATKERVEALKTLIIPARPSSVRPKEEPKPLVYERAIPCRPYHLKQAY